ncbi:MAG TPA: hypothetical protein VKY51_02175 [Fredinandcohnia sp.]|nr:hypothetical protein [Fredinandcohnia sp.]
MRREEPTDLGPDAFRRLDLDYRPRVEAEPGADEAPDGPASTDPREEARAIEERLETYFRDRRAEEHARTRVQPEVAELRKRLERRFTIPMEVLEEVPTDHNLGLSDALRVYATQAERYAATGNPYGDGLLAPGAPEGPETIASEIFRLQHADAELEPPISSTTATVTTLVVRIEILRTDEGFEARVLESSGVPRFDALALEQVRRELARVTLPPDVRRMRWALASTLRVTPPGPTIGRSIDQAFIPQECFYPGSKHQWSRVYLEALYLD